MLCLSEAGSGKPVFFHPVFLEEWRDTKHQGENEWMITHVHGPVAEREILGRRGERERMREQGGSVV